MSPLLVATHLLAFGLGGLATRYAVPRLLDAREVDGHLVIETHHQQGDRMSDRRRPNWLGVVILVASAMVIGIGVQAWLHQKQQTSQHRTDRQYADCLTKFASDLVTTIQARTEANSAVEHANALVDRAATQRDDAADEVFGIVARSLTNPQPGDNAAFKTAIQGEVAARRNLDVVTARADKIKADAEQVKQHNQYVLPQAVCSR